MENNKTIFLAKNISELLYQIKNVSGLQIVGGCSSIKSLPEKALSVRDIAELKAITMRERSIDFGPAVTLNEIIKLGRERVPTVLYDACESVANFFVRNLATIGGNICASASEGASLKRTLYAPLLALGASVKFRNTDNQMSVTLPFSKFTGVPEKQVLVSVRVPSDDWDVSIFRRLGPTRVLSESSASFCFLAKTQGNVLSSVKLAFAGPIVLQDNELETKLLGARLPLNEKTIQDFTAAANQAFDKAAGSDFSAPLLKEGFLQLTRFSLNQLT